MGIGIALGDAMMTGFGLYDRDRQLKEARAEEQNRMRLQAELNRELETLRTTNDKALEDQRYQHDLDVGKANAATRMDDWMRQRNIENFEAAGKADQAQHSFNDFLQQLPTDRARQKARAKSYDVSLDDADLMTPEEQAAAAKTKTQTVEDEAYARARGTERGQASVPKFELQPKDDPALPNGVRLYIGKLASKYQNRAEALAEVKRAWAELTAAHPRLDARKVQEQIDALYGPAPKDDFGAPTAAAPTTPAAPAGRGTAPAPSSATPSAQRKVGDQVKLRDGSTVTITKVNPDGTYDVQ